MAGLRVSVLLVLSGTLLWASVQGWARINQTQLLGLYEAGQRGGVPSFTSTDNNEFEDEEIPEDAMPEFEGHSTTDNFDPFALHGVQNENDFGGRNWVSGPDGSFQVEFVNAPPPPRSWTSTTSPSSSGIAVICSEAGFQIFLPSGRLDEVKVLGSKELLPIMDAPVSCGYDVNLFKNTLTVPFTGCNVRYANGYSLQLLYTDAFGATQVATASCEESLKGDSSLFPRANAKPKVCPYSTTPPPTTPPSKAKNCGVAIGERVTCGQLGIMPSACMMMGCCVDLYTSACYYPMDECTADQHFVFAIRSNSASIPVDPTKLVIPGTNCKPVFLNDQVAIFKFKVTECGTHFYEVGGTKIYLAEVQSVVQALNLKYGIITRSDPLRFMVECRYGKGGAVSQSLASIGYMVKTPSSPVPTSVVNSGLYGVQLRIAKDQTYSSYLPTYHQPLRLLLGKPVYLELRLKSPKPDAVILVNYCLAYPRSAKNALVLVYEGCANPLDPNVSILKVSDLPTNRHQRRFVVTAFQFMDQLTNKYLDEEIYFMCSSEVCRPAEKTCAERCFDGKVSHQSWQCELFKPVSNQVLSSRHHKELQ
ncbi:zona pellucida sperm-binding protein 4-like [Echeneis naucrates]|uniref:Zona pellucida sperm-binding protein 4-like n=1 Tax=Echeneis naucrates TaxID=173247 RepID=A0A665TQZ5_ECHNA|nr:zona pellucida sperm-binding protein 4-like [Echeneis naucrates]